MSANDREKDGLEKSALLTSRARNRTVMLSSDMTGQVRSLIQEKDRDEDEDSGSTKSDHGFVAPFSLPSTPDPEETKANGVRSNLRNNQKTDLMGTSFRAPSFESKSEESTFSSVYRDSENEEAHLPVSVKEILKTKELSRHKGSGSDTSTLIHPA